MNSKLLKIVNPIMGFVLLIVIVVLAIMKFGEISRTLIEIHEIAGYTLIALLLIHIILNRKWYKTLFKKK